LAQAQRKTWSFDADPIDSPPAGFRLEKTDGGAPGRWLVRAESDAPSARNVLAQVDADDSDGRFPIAVADEPSLADLRLSVKCKPVAGRVDQACGLVFRYQDANNYYVARANALEGNVRFYFVKNGRRKQLASWSGEVSSGAWHELRAEVRGDAFQIYWEGTKVLETNDKTFPGAGRVGVWTKADSVTLFDDLTVAAL
jgi:hypothetical protein